MYKTHKLAKFSYRSTGDVSCPTPSPTSMPDTVKVDFCDSDDYDKLEVINGGFTYDTTYDGVTCVAETTEEEDWNYADYPDDFTVWQSVSESFDE